VSAGLHGVVDDVGSDDACVYEKYAPELIRFAAALVGLSGAEDLLAVAVVEALGSPRWRQVDNKRAYLYRAVLHQAYKAQRSAQRRLNRELAAASPAAVGGEVTDWDLVASLRRLTVRQRAVVFFIYWVDLPPAEVADALGVSRRTVERELTAARRRLEALLS
jgi:RNA polymerase sigma factor (sigma-70 family)